MEGICEYRDQSPQKKAKICDYQKNTHKKIKNFVSMRIRIEFLLQNLLLD